MDIFVDSPNLVSENLRFVLEQEGISENALANRTDGVGQKTIWNMIHRSGSQGPTVSTLELIANSLDLELWELAISSSALRMIPATNTWTAP